MGIIPSVRRKQAAKAFFVGSILYALSFSPLLPQASAAKYELSKSGNYSVTLDAGSSKAKPGGEFAFELGITVPRKDWANFVLPSTPPGSPLWYGVFSDVSFSVACKTKTDTKLIELLVLYINHNTSGTRMEKLSLFQQKKANSRQKVATLDEGESYLGRIKVPANCLNLEFTLQSFGTWAVTGEGNNPYTGKIEQREFLNKVILETVNHSIEVSNFSSRTIAAPTATTPRDGERCKTLGEKVKSKQSELVCASGNKYFYWQKVPQKTTGPKPTTSPAKTAACSTQTARVIGSLGSTTYQGDVMSALLIENLSDCSLSTSAAITFICPTGGPINNANWIIATSAISMMPREKLAISSIEIPRYFPTATSECFRLTGVRTNIVYFSKSAPVMVRVVSAR